MKTEIKITAAIFAAAILVVVGGYLSRRTATEETHTEEATTVAHTAAQAVVAAQSAEATAKKLVKLLGVERAQRIADERVLVERIAKLEQSLVKLAAEVSEPGIAPPATALAFCETEKKACAVRWKGDGKAARFCRDFFKKGQNCQ